MRRIITTLTAVLAAFILAACGSSADGKAEAEGSSAPGPGKPATPTPATQSKAGVDAAERALVKAYGEKRWHVAYQMQSQRCRDITPFESFQGQIMMGFGMLPPDMDWTPTKVEVLKINADKTEARAKVHIPDLQDAFGPPKGDKWVYEAGEDGAKSWHLDDCEEPAA